MVMSGMPVALSSKDAVLLYMEDEIDQQSMEALLKVQ